MNGLRIREGFFEWNNELPNSNVSVKEDSLVSINLQSVLLTVLREDFFYHQIRYGGEKTEKLIPYLNHNYKDDLCSFENYYWTYVHVDGSDLNEVVSLI